MPRPRLCRYVSQQPNATFFKPCGVPMQMLDMARLPVEGLEALRLSDIEGLNTTEAAEKMRISRFTYARILAAARKTVAEALVHGKALCVEGGTYEFDMSGKDDACRKRRRNMPIIAISSDGPSLEDAVDPRYGRAGGFIIATVPGDGGEPAISYMDNGDAQMLPQGAGIATTEHLANAGVTTVISGYVGPKAFEALQAAGITVIQDMDGMTAGEALRRFLAGECKAASAPNREAGMQGGL